MNKQAEASDRADQREGSPSESPLPIEGKPLHSVETDEYDRSYRGNSPSDDSSHRDHDDHSAAYSDKISTRQKDPSPPHGDNESTTSGTEIKQDWASSSSLVDFDKQERQSEKPKAISSEEINQAKWDALFGRLLKYKDEFGDCLVPNRYETDPSLGAWVSTQRRQYKILKSGSFASTPMTPERAKTLDRIGFAWSTTDPRHIPWEQRYQELVAFKNEHGHCVVPIAYNENIQLANWVSTQRQEAKLMREGRSTRLSEKKIEKLNSIGFVWVAPRGCSGKLKRLREHEVNYQQEQQARQERDPNNCDNLNGLVASTNERIEEATAKVSAAAAEIIHGAPTMGQGSPNPTSPLPQTTSVCSAFGSSHDTPSYQLTSYLAQQGNSLPYPNTNMLPHLFPSRFDLGSITQDESLWRLVQQRRLLAGAALFPSLSHQAPTSALAQAFQDMAGTNLHFNSNAGLLLYQQTLAASLASMSPPNIFPSAAAIASAGLVGISPSGLEAAQANFAAHSLLMSAGLALSTNNSMLTTSNLNLLTNSTEEQERNADDYDNEEPPPSGNQ